MSSQFLIPNGSAALTSARAVLLTGAASLKTHLQVHLGDSYTSFGKIIEWGVSFNGDPTAVAAADSAICELLTTGVVAATAMVAHAAATINLLQGHDPVPVDNYPFAFGTGETAYGDASVTEGSTTVSSTKDVQQIPPNSWFIKQFPLGYQPTFLAAEFLRVRIISPIDVGAIAYVIVDV